jgi:hypothetical protein
MALELPHSVEAPDTSSFTFKLRLRLINYRKYGGYRLSVNEPNLSNRAPEPCCSVLPKSLGTFIKILAISVLPLGLSAIAQEKSGWQFDSLQAPSIVFKTDAQQVYEVLLKMLDRWNAHDI